MGEKDITEKILEDYNDVFADIVNTLLFHGRSKVKPEELENVKDKSMYKADGRIHEQERDVAKRWKKDGTVITLYGLENQTSADADMPFRVMGYDGASYRRQLSRGKERYPVITLILYYGDEPWQTGKSIYEVLKIDDDMKSYVSDYRITVIDIKHLSEETIRKFNSDFGAIVDYLVNAKENESYKASTKTLKHTDEVIKLLSAVTGDVRYEDVEVKGDGSMCEILDMYIAKGEARGKDEGIKIGEARGRNEGIRLGEAGERIKSVARMLGAGLAEELIAGMGYSMKEIEKAKLENMQ